MVMREIWKDIPGYENFYEVSNLGRIKSVERKITNINGRTYTVKTRILKNGLSGCGYLLVVLQKKGKNKKSIKVHSLVAMCFLNYIKKQGSNICIDHIDNNKLNNHISNLQLITHRFNSSKDKKYKTSKYTGVHWDNQHEKWRASISVNNKKYHLGRFINEDDAKIAYDLKLASLK